MRRLVYFVACTADGFIAHPDGSFAGFPADEAYFAALASDFPETFPAPFRKGSPTRAENRRFDAVLMGRKTYEVGLRDGLASPYPTLDQYVFTRSLKDRPHPDVTLVGDDAASFVSALKERGGKAIWLCGGSRLATTLFASGSIDELIVKVNPVLFGAGLPLLARSEQPVSLELTETFRYPSGHMRLHYSVLPSTG
jgi:dihydrofolate reductase